jgi:5-methyltetrahydrofolate--homocysteine methyltransferase
MRNDKNGLLLAELKKRILVLDGAMGTMIQNYSLSENDFRGDRFRNHNNTLTGNNDILSLTQPGIIENIHKAYLDAGADIITTNTFSSISISQSIYGTDEFAYELNFASARLAKKAARDYESRNPEQHKFVAGSIGPSGKSLSIPSLIDKPGYRDITFDLMVDAYKTAVKGMIDGGIDILLVETVFDTLNAKAALYAIQEMLAERNIEIPIWISASVTHPGGRTLSGQSIEAFWYSIRHINPICVGLNCGFGAANFKPYITELSEIANTAVSIHPNAGLPDEDGNYDNTPSDMAEVLENYATDGLINIVGGCCGTNPEYIRAIADKVDEMAPRQILQKNKYCYLSGSEALVIKPNSLFVNIGEKTNIAGSAKFKRLILEEKYDSAAKIAYRQVKNGAQAIDIGMDDPLLDSKNAMTCFLNQIAADPFIGSVPIMIDSSQWDVIEAGLKCLQGKGIVNSISLKDGESEFLKKAGRIRRFGAAVVVMAFDEEGQAVTYQRKVDICTRAYNLLTKELDFPPEDIIFDPNILTIATGIEDHDNYANDYLRACQTIKETLPHCLVSGGISNLSFAFRGNNAIREAMHSIFLYHAVKAGMDMGIVDAGQIMVYEDIPSNLKDIIEDIILNRKTDALNDLLAMAANLKGIPKRGGEIEEWRNHTPEERLIHSIINGIDDYIKIDVTDVLAEYVEPLKVIEIPLMNAMKIISEYFGSGKMFLPQVIKSAGVMKRAVGFLSPYLRTNQDGLPDSAGKILLATVKGDVHDIGKNITRLLLECNNYQIIDLGVMVPADKIVDTAINENVNIIGLSGLITPSLNEMINVVKELERRNLQIPVIIGGATTSETHTALKIDPAYSGGVVHVPDASQSLSVINQLLSKSDSNSYIQLIKNNYKNLRQERTSSEKTDTLIPLEQARKYRYKFDWGKYTPLTPNQTGVNVLKDYPIEALVSDINWKPIFKVFDLYGGYKGKTISDNRKLLEKDAKAMLDKIIADKLLITGAVFGLFPANSISDSIEIYSDSDRAKVLGTFHCLRQQNRKSGSNDCYCLSDFIAPKESGTIDYIGAFAITAGLGIEQGFKNLKNDYEKILLKVVADRLAEAFSKHLHDTIEKEFWGYRNKTESTDCKVKGIRPAVGYPTCPDHSDKQMIFDLLRVESSIGMKLSTSYSLIPGASVCGWYLAHPNAKYFSVGNIGQDQLYDYANRKDLASADVSQWLAITDTGGIDESN